MIHLYTSKRCIPKDKKLIESADAYFDALISTDGMRFDELDRKIMKLIDRASIVSEGFMKTPYGDHVDLGYLSTGSKTLILINHADENRIINISGCGRNALEWVFNQFDDKNYYLSYCITPNKMNPTIVNNRKKIYTNSISLLEIWDNK